MPPWRSRVKFGVRRRGGPCARHGVLKILVMLAAKREVRAAQRGTCKTNGARESNYSSNSCASYASRRGCTSSGGGRTVTTIREGGVHCARGFQNL